VKTYVEWMVENFLPGITLMAESAFPCAKCGALVTIHELELHVKWHETLVTTNATYIMRTPEQI